MDEESLEWKLPDEEELNLIYVAVTRAIKGLDLGSLSWVLEETTDDDAAYRQPSAEESVLNMAIPTKKVSKVEFVEMVDEADQALAAKPSGFWMRLKQQLRTGKPPPWVAPMAGNNQKSKYYSGSSSYKCYYR